MMSEITTFLERMGALSNRPYRTSLVSLMLLGTMLAVSGCSDSEDDDTATGVQDDQGDVVPAESGALPEAGLGSTTSQDNVAGVRIEDYEGTYSPGSPPEVSGSLSIDPLTTATADTAVIPGGSITIPVVASAPFSTVFVVANQDGESAAGYFEVLLPAAVTQADLVITYQSQLDDGSAQQVGVQVGAPDGSISSVSAITLQTMSVNTGDLQVSVSWDKESDVDLYLLEPGGEEISFHDPQSQAGGVLDPDSNTACYIDGIKYENISYEGVTPPPGAYRVAVEYYSPCNEGSTNYVVTVQNKGATSTFNGTLTNNFERQEVTTFDVR